MLKEDIMYLSGLRGVTGREGDVSAALEKILNGLVDTVSVDRMGNVTGRIICPHSDAPTLVLTAHMDQVGLVVTGIHRDGFVRVAPLGGIDPRSLLGMKMSILTDKGALPCLVAAIPPHIQKPGDDAKAVQVTDLWIDTGLPGDLARERIQIGDVICFDVRPMELLNGRVTGAALDDRVGIACILEALRSLHREALSCNLAVVFTTMEEINHQGCAAALRRLGADYLIAVDACHARTPGCREYDRVHDFGCGAVIAFGMNSIPPFARRLEMLAKKQGIPWDREALPGNTFTDAWIAQVADEGIRTAVLSFPLRHMHTPVEVVDLRDACAVAMLLASACMEDWGGEYE